jgi:phosphoglycerate kinase
MEFIKHIGYLLKGERSPRSVDSLPHIKNVESLKGKRVLVRVDFNVPLNNDENISSDEAWRIDAALPTINFLRNAEAKVVLISHIGREPGVSLQPAVQYLNTVCNIPTGFVPKITGPLVEQAVKQMGAGRVLLLENIRSDERETKNDQSFAEELATIADIYVNDAFSASHRDHASIVGVPKCLTSYFGFQFIEEVKHLSQLHDPGKPLLAIVGGAKFKTKLPLIQKLIKTAETVFVGGALAHTFFVYKGFHIGTSLFEEFTPAKKLLKERKIKIPLDVVVQYEKGLSKNVNTDAVGEEDKIVDLGEATIQSLKKEINEARTIIWNGPLGWYEGGYEEGTKKLLDLVAQSHTTSIIGGGDTVFVIRKYGMEKKFTFISTAGGAMLDYLTKGTLPGIEAIV